MSARDSYVRFVACSANVWDCRAASP